MSGCVGGRVFRGVKTREMEGVDETDKMGKAERGRELGRTRKGN